MKCTTVDKKQKTWLWQESAIVPKDVHLENHGFHYWSEDIPLHFNWLKIHTNLRARGESVKEAWIISPNPPPQTEQNDLII